MKVTARATVRLKFPKKGQLSAIFRALEPETRLQSTSRSKVIVKRDGETLTLVFEASDTSALRAAMNSYLHWIRLARDVLESVEAS